MKELLTSSQVEALEQLEHYINWLECYGSINTTDVDYLQELIDNLAASIAQRKKENELAEKSPWLEEGNGC